MLFALASGRFLGLLAPTGESQGLLDRVETGAGLLGQVGGLGGMASITEEGNDQGGACLVILAAQQGRQLLDDCDALFALQLVCLVAHCGERPGLVEVNPRSLAWRVALVGVDLPQLGEESRRLRGRFGFKGLFLMWPGTMQASTSALMLRLGNRAKVCNMHNREKVCTTHRKRCAYKGMLHT